MFAACNGTGKLAGHALPYDGPSIASRLYDGPPNGQFAYVPHDETKPYFAMAREWVLADRMFASQLDESFVAHQYVIAAQAQSSVNVPGLLWGCAGGAQDEVATLLTAQRTYGYAQRPCFDYQTIGDELDHAGLPGVSTRASYYRYPTSGFWSAYQAVRHIFYGPDWHKDVVVPQKRFLTDVAGGKLAAFTWVTPTCVNSDHPACGGGYGPVLGRERRQRRGREPVLEHDRDLRAVGRLGRPLRSRAAAVRRIPTATASACRCSSSRRTPSAVTYRTCATRRQACCVSPKTSSA